MNSYSSVFTFVLSLLSLSTLSTALNCTAQYQCQSISQDYNYILCDNGVCRCRTELGFSNNAAGICSCINASVYWGGSPSLPYCISCHSPRSVQYDEQGIPVCVSLVECDSLTKNSDREQILKNALIGVYESLVHGVAIQILATGVLPSVFSPNVKGRVVGYVAFNDTESVFEGLYGLSAAAHIVSVNIRNIVADISPDNTGLVAIYVDVLTNVTDANLLLNLTAMGFWKFDTENQIIGFDFTELRLGQAEDPLAQAAASALKDQICQIHGAFCTGANQQYANFTVCRNFMDTIPFGTFDHADSVSVVCKIVHMLLVPFRPTIHCPHIGPTGGNACINSPYTQFYTQNFV